jgi:hypothetical protein
MLAGKHCNLKRCIEVQTVPTIGLFGKRIVIDMLLTVLSNTGLLFGFANASIFQFHDA